MRRLTLFILLATVAAPALAGADERDDRRAARAEAKAARAEAREERSADRPARVERAEPIRVERSAPPQRENFAGTPRPERQRAPVADVERGLPDREFRGAPERQSADTVRNWRERERDRQRAGSPAAVEQVNNDRRSQLEERRQQRIEQRADRAPVRAPRALPVSNTPQPGTQPPSPARSVVDAARHSKLWRTDWRRDNRYDWSDHRRRHRSLFHLGFYYDPFGWGYSRYYPGWRLWPSYYSSNYWLNDPYMYRLPYAPYPYKWVRYYDDALLVDTWSGEVVDVMYDFFW